MEKLTSQIAFDSEHFCHMFLGAFKSNIAKVFSTFLILAYIFFHSKLKKFLKEHKTK
jgi:membrane-bound acyltransferase YfiQ involved in biofilm formation